MATIKRVADAKRQKTEREPVNPKWLLRRLMECLPTGHEEFVGPAITALWAFSDDYLLKEDLEAGIIRFTGTVAYSQLAEFSGVDRETAKWRAEQVRERWGLVSWKRSKLGIRFVVSYESANRLPDSEADAKHVLTSSIPIEIGNGDSESGNGGSEIGNGSAESGNGYPTLALSGFKSTGTSGAPRTKSFENQKTNSKTQDQTVGETPTTPASQNPTQPRTLGESIRELRPPQPVPEKKIEPPPVPRCSVHGTNILRGMKAGCEECVG